MAKVLVTGGSDLVGSNIVEELLNRGETVRVINNFSTVRRRNVAVGERYMLNFLVSETCRIVGKHVEPVYDKPRPGDVKHSLASVKVLKEQLGLRQPVDFVEGSANLCLK